GDDPDEHDAARGFERRASRRMTDVFYEPGPTDMAAASTRPLIAASLRPVSDRAPVLDREPVRAWSRRYVSSLLITDAVAAIAAIAAGWFIRFGVPSDAEIGQYLLAS